MEVWSHITGSDYYTSNLGRIKNKKGAILKGHIHRGTKNYSIHRLIALAFCPKEQGKDYVNHIDGNYTNNKALNLEWVHSKRKRPTCRMYWTSKTISC